MDILNFWLYFSLFLGIVILGIIGFFLYQRKLFFYKQVERALKMVPLLIKIPYPDPEDLGSKNPKVYMEEQLAIAEQFIAILCSIYKKGFKSFLFGQRHLIFEIIASKNEILFYVVAPVSLLDLVEKAITAQYPKATVEETEEHNIFSQISEIKGIAGGSFYLSKNPAFPINTFRSMDVDPLKTIVNSLSNLQEGEGAAIQILFRPVDPSWSKEGSDIVKAVQKGEYKEGFKIPKISLGDIFRPGEKKGFYEQKLLTPAEEEKIKRITEKAQKPAFEATVRLIVSSSDHFRAETVLSSMLSGFIPFNNPDLNSFKFEKPENLKSLEKFATNFIFRFFPRSKINMIINSEELASLFHPPNVFIDTPGVQWSAVEKVTPPVEIPQEGTILGKVSYRGQERKVYILENDKMRHLYMVGQTGTGKSTFMENMVIDDIQKGKGVAVIDPHGQTVDHILTSIPKERAEDVILFDAGDIERPLGMNVFEFKKSEQKDFLIQEMISILYKLYDPGHTGIIGPRYEHWFRNAALTLMADPKGATLIEIPKVFMDEEFLNEKLQYVTDPVILDFWQKEMAQTSSFHKSEILGWFVSKFGAFAANEIMRNIIGQVKSAFDLREVMDSGKILLINLSKGRVGELNSMLLGMIFVTKIQMAALSRADAPESQRPDFYLYVDEFQNFSTDSFVTILSEARKYHLGLIVANQYIGQLTEDVRGAVFGNVGTLISCRVGATDAEYLARELTPVFREEDLVNMPNWNAAIRLSVNGIPSRPFSIQGLPPMAGKDAEVGESIRNLSRLKYGRDKTSVDAEIKERMVFLGSESLPPEKDIR